MESKEVLITTADKQTAVFYLTPLTTSNEILELFASFDFISEVAIRDNGHEIWSTVSPVEDSDRLLSCNECTTLIPADIHEAELGFCLECSNSYWNHDND
jgi:hypothetical protein